MLPTHRFCIMNRPENSSKRSKQAKWMNQVTKHCAFELVAFDTDLESLLSETATNDQNSRNSTYETKSAFLNIDTGK